MPLHLCQNEVFRSVLEFQFKKGAQEDPELTSSHRHTDSIVTYGTFPLKKTKGWLRDEYTSGKRENYIKVGKRGWDTISP